jgi:hypothetical protein
MEAEMSQPPDPPPYQPGPPQPPYPPQSPYQPQQYGGYPPPAPAPPTNTLAIIALVCAFVFAPAGLVCGILARRQIRQTGEQGDGLALAAIIVSIAQIIIGLAVIAFFIVTLVVIGTAVSHLPSPSPFPS